MKTERRDPREYSEGTANIEKLSGSKKTAKETNRK